MKWIKRFLLTACALVLSASVLMAAEDSDITIEKKDFNDKFYKEVTWFETYDLGGSVGTDTYVYNPLGETTDSDGLVEATLYSLAKSIQIRIATLGSTDIDVRIEGRAGADANWAEIVTKNFTAVTTIDYIVSAIEFIDEIRVGARANGTAGTDDITVTGILLGGDR